MLTLPKTESRAHLRAFWLAIVLTAAALAAAVCRLADLSSAMALPVLLVAPLGLARPAIATGPYRAWNLLAGLAVRAARRWLSGLCFLVVTAAGVAGSRLRWSPRSADESGWQARRVRLPIPVRARKLWPTFLWSLRPRNAWSLGLLPYLLLLRILAPAERNVVHEHIYTLY